MKSVQAELQIFRFFVAAFSVIILLSSPSALSQITHELGRFDAQPDIQVEFADVVYRADGSSYTRPADSIDNAGDVNGDGIDDFVVGYRFYQPAVRANGKAAIVFGQEGGLPEYLTTEDLDGSNGVVLQGYRFEEYVGGIVKGIGDFNGDGFDDVAIEANIDYEEDTSRLYVVFGRASFPSQEFELRDLDGSQGFVIESSGVEDAVVFSSFAGPGDVNDDGLSDLVIGAPRSIVNNAVLGRVYVLFGQADDRPATMYVESTGSLENPGVVLVGSAPDRLYIGGVVSSAGDLNADGIADISLGHGWEEGGNNSGTQPIVVFGGQHFAGTELTISDIDFLELPRNSLNHLTTPAVGVNDINADGVDDIAIPLDDGIGVFFGSAGLDDASIDVEQLRDGSRGMFIQNNEREQLPGYDLRLRAIHPVGPATDLDGDGTLDLVTYGFRETNDGLDSFDYYLSVVFYDVMSWHGQTLSSRNLDGCRGAYSVRDWSGIDDAVLLDVNGDGFLELADRYSPYRWTQESRYSTAFTKLSRRGSGVTDQSLVAHYAFNGSIADASTNCHHLSISGRWTPALTSSMRSILLKPTVRVASPPRLTLGFRPGVAIRDDLTVRANIRPQTDGYSPIVTRYTSRTVNRRKLPAYSLQIMPNRRVRFSWLRAGSGTVEHCTTRANVLRLRSFNDVTATRNADTGLVRIWADGRPVRVCRAPAGKLNSTRMAMYIGAFKAGLPASTATVRLDDLKLYSRVLTASEIRQ